MAPTRPAATATAPGALQDRYGRIATDLRISVTDRCDLRCTYCMPAEGLDWLPSDQLLSFDEIERLASLFVTMGVRTVRLTGGEPLLRPRLAALVARLAALGLDDLALTTNGTKLAAHAAALRASGLDRINVSLDSLSHHALAGITRRDVLDRVLEGIEAARRVGLSPVKVNCVVVAGRNDGEIPDFVDFARRTGCIVRFIEPMPIGAGGQWRPDQVLTAAQVLDRVRELHELVGVTRGSAPATTFRFADGAPGGVGVIGSVSDPFCGDCDRLRLTCDGQLRTCLFAHAETDLRGPMRDGATDDELIGLVRAAVLDKGPGHAIGQAGFEQPVRVMSRIGG
jgi:cyclic pyranopterin phosphate synthase